jgi:hypothetical protein
MYRVRGKNRIDVPDCGRRRLLFRVMWWEKKGKKEGSSSLLRTAITMDPSVQHVALYYFYFIVLKFPSSSSSSSSSKSLFHFNFIFPFGLSVFFWWVEHEENWTGSFYIHSPFTLLSSSSPIRLRVWHILVYSTHTQRNAFLYFIFWLGKRFSFLNSRHMMAATF